MVIIICLIARLRVFPLSPSTQAGFPHYIAMGAGIANEGLTLQCSLTAPAVPGSEQAEHKASAFSSTTSQIQNVLVCRLARFYLLF